MNTTEDSKKREIEINEWNYHAKMETLFSLQLLFVGLSVALILSVLAKYGFFSRLFAIYMGLAIVAIVILIAIVRQLYTKNIRNKRHWNERQFTGDNSLASLVPQSVLAATAAVNAQMCNGAASSGKPVVVSCP
jgi:ABC-type transport system involved in cytochrome bd biosynthesis fused ATPase/permease subunit